jgi:hypothetical protein
MYVTVIALSPCQRHRLGSKPSVNIIASPAAAMSQSGMLNLATELIQDIGFMVEGMFIFLNAH